MGERRFVGSRWIALSTVGLAVGIPGGLVLGAPAEVIVGAMIVTPVMLALSGLFLGAFQWIVLRRVLTRPARWLILTTLGFSAAFTIAVVTLENGGAWLSGAPVRLATAGMLGLIGSVLFVGVLGGALLGLSQSVALGDYPDGRKRWVVASAVGLGLGFVAGALLASVLGGIMSGLGLVAFLIVSGSVYSWVTGRTLGALVAAA